MKRLLKWMSILVGLVAIALVAAVVAVTSLVEPNQFKPLIISQFKQVTGFEISIPGDLSWSFFPHLGMQVKDVTVNDPAVFTANLKDLVLRAQLGPLLQKQLEFSKVSIGELQVNDLQASNARAKVHYQDQLLEIQQIKADLYQGDLNANMTVSLKESTPRLHSVGSLDKVQVVDLLKGFSGKASRLQFASRGDLHWDVTTQGKKTEELLSHLNGVGRVRLDKGSIKGIDLAYFMDTAAALINKEPLPTQTPNGETEFKQLTATVTIKDGVLSSNDLLLDSALYSIKAVGWVDLVNKTLDYHVDVSSKIQEKTNKLLALYGKTIPIRVSGSLNDPTVTLDTLALMKEIGQEQLQRVGEEIQKRLPDKANSFIKSLFH